MVKKNAWNNEEDKYLRSIVLIFKEDNKTLKEALTNASIVLDRSFYACENRWRKIKNDNTIHVKFSSSKELSLEEKIKKNSNKYSRNFIPVFLYKQLGKLPNDFLSDSVDFELLQNLLAKQEIDYEKQLENEVKTKENQLIKSINSNIEIISESFQTNSNNIDSQTLLEISKMLTNVLEYQILLKSKKEVNNN